MFSGDIPGVGPVRLRKILQRTEASRAAVVGARL